MSDLLPCPFCGGMPRIDLAKKEHCQLHGDPSQAVKVYCYHDCPSRPSVIAGDVYNGGEAQAKSEAIARWNKRAALEPSGVTEAARVLLDMPKDDRMKVWRATRGCPTSAEFGKWFCKGLTALAERGE